MTSKNSNAPRAARPAAKRSARTKTSQPQPPAEKYKPTAAEFAAVETRIERTKNLPPLPSVKLSGTVETGLKVQIEHPDHDTGAIMLSCSVGGGWAFAETTLSQLVNIIAPSCADPAQTGTLTVNAILQSVRSMEPTSELEGMMAIQIATMHHATMETLRKAHLPQATFEGRAMNLSQANKLSRTFCTLVETLNRHRGKVTTQKVIVENVYVAAGGQAVVGAVASGGGQALKIEEQTHGPTHGGEKCGPLLSEDTTGNALPSPSFERPRALQEAWRSEGNWRAEGQPEQPEARQVLSSDPAATAGNSRAA